MSTNESYIQSLFADRLGGDSFGKDTKIYKFEKIKRAKRAAMEANPDKELRLSRLKLRLWVAMFEKCSGGALGSQFGQFFRVSGRWKWKR